MEIMVLINQEIHKKIIHVIKIISFQMIKNRDNQKDLLKKVNQENHQNINLLDPMEFLMIHQKDN